MPVIPCQQNGKPGFRWGSKQDSPSSKCYTYDPNSPSSKRAAKQKAIKQGVAIKLSKLRRNK